MKQSISREQESSPNAHNASAKESSFVDMRPSATTHRELNEMVAHSPQTVAQHKRQQNLFGTTVQRQQEEEEEKPAQAKAASEATPKLTEATPEPNNTGLPDKLKAGIESLSGMAMDNVKVHYNSSAPAQLQAHAYAQGNEIHLAPGQEQHLPHEAWHVVQQAQGRVPVTRQMRGIDVNDDGALEQEADVMGTRAASSTGAGKSVQLLRAKQSLMPLQAKRPVRQYVYMQLAQDFENHLGKYCFSHARAQAGATAAINRMKGAMGVTALAANAGQVFGGDDPRYPGNVGRDAVRVLAAVDTGNLREKMTGFYNASLGPFKKMLTDRIQGKGEWANGNAAAADLRLQNRGLNVAPGSAIHTRTTQITGSYYNLTPGGSKMKDLYVAPGDYKTRNTDTDELYKGQSLIKSKEARVDALDMDDNARLNALTVEGMAQLTITEADLVGDHNAMLGNAFGTSTYLKIRTALRDLRVSRGDGSAQSVVLKHLSEVKKNTWKWLKDNTGEKDLVSNFRRIHGEAGRKMGTLNAATQQAMLLLPAALRLDPEAADAELANIVAGTFNAFDPALYTVDRAALAGDQAAFMGDAGGADGYVAIVDKVREIQGGAGPREKVRALHQLNAMIGVWNGQNGNAADARILATANRNDANNKVKKRVAVERLQDQLEKVYSATGRSNNDLRTGALDARLSAREQAHLMETQAARFDNGAGVFVNNARLPWEEGGTRYKPNLANSWMDEAVNTLKMPVTSGPSGTTDRMFQALHLLGHPAGDLDFRLALLGWMMTSGDHSFHEIMAVAKAYGCAYVPGPKSYRNIQPLTEAELRVHVCLAPGYLRLFPDEVDYHTDMDQGRHALYAPIVGDLNAQTQHNPLLEHQMGMNAGTYNASEKPKLLRNVTAYTTTAYAVQNTVANDSKIVAMGKIKSMMSTARSHPTLIAKLAPGGAGFGAFTAGELATWTGLSFADKHMVRVLAATPNITADQLYAEAVRHNEFTLEAMRQLPNYAGVAWRGEAMTSLTGSISGYDLNSTFTMNKFMSASSRDVHVNGYVKLARGITEVNGVDQERWYTSLRKGVILRIVSQHGKIADSVSINEDGNARNRVNAPATAEVIFIPGTRFTVTSAPYAVAGKNSPVVDITEQ